MWKSSSAIFACLLPEQVIGYKIYSEGGFKYENL